MEDTSVQPSLLDLPLPLLSHILTFTASDEPCDSLSYAALGCKTLRLAADESKRAAPLCLTMEKLEQARVSGLESDYLHFLANTRSWERAEVQVGLEADLSLVLHSLATGRGLQHLKLLPAGIKAGVEDEKLWTLPQELSGFTMLTSLELQLWEDWWHTVDAVEFVKLSSLTALQSLAFEGALTGPMPLAAFHSLQQLTSLRLTVDDPESLWFELAPQLACEHFAALPALSRLELASVKLSLLEDEVPAAWKHIEELALRHASVPHEAGFWCGLARLGHLTSLVVDDVLGQPSAALRSTLHTYQRLAVLWLSGYSEPAIPQLPSMLTSLWLDNLTDLRALPPAPGLRSLSIHCAETLQDWPSELSVMAQLTELRLRECGLRDLPAPLAALPALQVLDLGMNCLRELPQLAGVGSLRTLLLDGNSLKRVPKVLGGGAASRLQQLNMGGNEMWAWEDDVAMLASLPTLQTMSMTKPLDASSLLACLASEGLQADPIQD